MKERELLRRISSHSESRIPAHFIYEIQELLAQPDINTQYLLDQVSRLTAENAMLKEKWLAQPEQKPLTREEISYGFRTNDADLDAESYWAGVKYAEKMHGVNNEISTT